MLWLLSFLCIQHQLWFPSAAKMWSHVECAARMSGEVVNKQEQIRFKVLDFLSVAAQVFKYFQGSQHGPSCLKYKPHAWFCVSRCQWGRDGVLKKILTLKCISLVFWEIRLVLKMARVNAKSNHLPGAGWYSRRAVAQMELAGLFSGDLSKVWPRSLTQGSLFVTPGSLRATNLRESRPGGWCLSDPTTKRIARGSPALQGTAACRKSSRIEIRFRSKVLLA